MNPEDDFSLTETELRSELASLRKSLNLSPACGYEGEHYHAPGIDPNCLGCNEIEEERVEEEGACE